MLKTGLPGVVPKPLFVHLLGLGCSSYINLLGHKIQDKTARNLVFLFCIIPNIIKYIEYVTSNEDSKQ